MGNIAGKLSPERRKHLGHTICEMYDEDLASRHDWECARERWLKFFAGRPDPKSYPWPNCSNIHVPMTAITCIQFNARAYTTLYDSSEVVKAVTYDGNAKNSAKRVSKAMNWQLSNMGDYFEEADSMLMQLPLMGCAYKKVYYDPIKDKVVSKLLSTKDLVTSYNYKSFDRVPRKSQALYFYDWEIDRYGRLEYFSDYEDLPSQRVLSLGAPAQNIKAEEDRVSGMTAPIDMDKPRLLIECYVTMSVFKDEFAKPYTVTVDYETKRVLRVESRLVDDEEVEFFIPFTFIKTPESHYGIGYGQLLEHLNLSANTIINELIDAGHLHNIKCGVKLNKGLKQKGEFQFSMGKFVGVDSSADDIRKAILPFDFGPPSSTLFQLLSFVIDQSKQVANVTDALQGQMPASDTTASAAIAAVEQGLQVYAAIYRRLHSSTAKEFKLISWWNARKFPGNLYKLLQDSTSDEYKEMQELEQQYNLTSDEIMSKDFSSITEVSPVSDPSIMSKQLEQVRAQALYDTAMQNPLVQKKESNILEVSRRFYQAMGISDVDSFLQPEDPPPEPPDLPPLEEEAAAIRETYVEPLDHQDHAAHLRSHAVFITSEWASELSPQGKKVMDQHIMATKSLLYLQQSREDEALVASSEEAARNV